MSEFPKKAEDQTNVFGIIMIGVVSSVLVYVSIIALQAYYQNTEGPLAAVRDAEGAASEVRALEAKQRAAMQQTEYADAAKGLLKRLPIDVAQELVVRDLRERSPSLVPAVGPHDTPTVKAVFHKPTPEDAIQGEPPPADGVLPPVDGEPPPAGATDGEGEGEEGALPADDTGGVGEAAQPEAPGSAAEPTPAAPVPSPGDRRGSGTNDEERRPEVRGNGADTE